MKSSDVALFLNKQLVGNDVKISGYSTLSEIKSETVIFAKKFSKDTVCILNSHNDILAIVCPEYAGNISCSHIITDRPRLDFIHLLKRFFVVSNSKSFIHLSAIIEDGAKIGKNVQIGANCYISAETEIGDETVIFPNVVITGKTKIGTNCIIKSGAVIGQSGFGFEFDDDDIPEIFPQLGRVEIGNNVYIGACTVVDCGALDVTCIKDNVKIDNLVHIAHNVVIEKNSLVIASAVLSGGVHVGEHAWIAPNASIREKINIGNNGFVGLGTVVVKDVDVGTTVVGNPAGILIRHNCNNKLNDGKY